MSYKSGYRERVQGNYKSGYRETIRVGTVRL